MEYVKYSQFTRLPNEIKPAFLRSNVIVINDVFEPLYTEKAFIKDLWGGRGAGRSHHATDYADNLLQNLPYCRIAILRYNLDSVRDSLWQDFIDRLNSRNQLERYEISNHAMRATCKSNGNKIIAKGIKATGAQTAKMKSIAGFTHVIIEEADEMPKEDFRKLSLSIRKKGVDIEIIRLFNPPQKSHWMWQDYILTPHKDYDGYFTAQPKEDSGILSIFSTYEANKHHLSDDYVHTLGKNKDNDKGREDWLKDGLGLIGSGLKGAIYKGWNRISLQEYEQIDYNKYYYIDWGTNDPTAIGEVKIFKDIVMIKPLVYEPMAVIDIAKRLCDLGFTEKDMIICDSSEPQSIMQLRNGFNNEQLNEYELEQRPQLAKGFTTIGVKKPKGSIEYGIKLLQSKQVYVVDTPEGDKAWNEYVGYCWNIDKNGMPTDQPIDKNNHHLDGIRYVVYSYNN